jgi:hypothetical protein
MLLTILITCLLTVLLYFLLICLALMVEYYCITDANSVLQSIRYLAIPSLSKLCTNDNIWYQILTDIVTAYPTRITSERGLVELVSSERI